jgi:hypothetical protein
VVSISGSDVGEFGDTPILALSECLAGAKPISLFIDARDVRGASIEVSAKWAGWLAKNRTGLSAVTMLPGSRFIRMTAEFVRRYSELEGIMRICPEPEVFEFELTRALGSEQERTKLVI